MDIEMVQKINKLAVDLLKQGMATSRIEAVQKAEEMLSRDGSREITDIQEAQPMQRVETQPETPARKPDPGLEQLKEAMLKNNTYFVKTFKELQGALSSIQGELSSLKQELTQLKKRAATPPQPTLSQIHEKIEIAKPAPVAATPPAKKESSHPRQGAYNPEDVSIEKMFYMGNK